MRAGIVIAVAWLAAGLELAVCSAVQGSVHLEYRPAQQSVTLGNVFEVTLFAVSDDDSNQSIGSIDLVLGWSPSNIELLGLNNNGPYNWLASNFPNDSGLDGLNAPFGTVPGNDGDAYYRALRRLPPAQPAFATPAGLLVTTFRFRALALTPSTLLTMHPSAGAFTRTLVIDGFTPGLDVTGELGSAAVTIIPEPALAALACCGLLLARPNRRRSATQHDSLRRPTTRGRGPSWHRTCLALAAVTACHAATVQAWHIDLELRPRLQTVPVGQRVYIGVWAASNLPSNHLMSAADLVFSWETGIFQLAGTSSAGAAPLMFSGFPSVSPNEQVPPADGDGYYNALALFGSPVVVTPTGVLLTTLLFDPIAPSSGSDLLILPSAGMPPVTTAAFDGTVPGLVITGALRSAQVIVIPEPMPALALAICAFMALLRRPRRLAIILKGHARGRGSRGQIVG